MIDGYSIGWPGGIFRVVSRSSVTIKYDGPVLADHKMPVDDLAPSVLALSELCKRLNEQYNGDRASVRLYIDVNAEQHCAEFTVELVQHVATFLQTVLSMSDGPATAKDILDWIIGGTSGLLGLYAAIRLLKGEAPPPGSTQLMVRDSKNVVQMTVNGNVYLAHPEAIAMLQDRESLKKAESVTAPLKKDGYEAIEFIDNGRVTEKVDRLDAENISRLANSGGPPPAMTLHQSAPIRAQVLIKKAVYKGAGKWTIQYDKAREMAFLDLDWLAEFQTNQVSAPPNSVLDVELAMSPIDLDKDNNPIKEPEYSIVKVHGVIPPPTQGQLV